MKKEAKAELISELAEQFEGGNFCLLNAQGLNVRQVDELRARCFELGITYRVSKNAFIKKALERQERSEEYQFVLQEGLTGFSGILFFHAQAASAARMLQRFRTDLGEGSLPQLKVAYLEGESFVGDEHLDTLSKIKSKKELIGDILLSLKSPVLSVLGGLSRARTDLAGVLKVLSDRK
ncbi:MAG: 50S ribosomal protein L10 [Cytophagales bacterium]|nr:50S ribosomal protein L10 [Cytophagales bacterium]